MFSLGHQKQHTEEQTITNLCRARDEGPLFVQAVMAFVITLGVLVLALWPLFTAPNYYYPYTVDGMGHLAKIKYIADCLNSLHWPAWFPYWYNGATVVQYYPPLSYFILAPIQMLSDNIMITFKCYVLLYLMIGAMGVWYVCYRWVGHLPGIIAAILYTLHPFILRSLASEGVIAQGPIFALSPWLLAATLLLVEKRTNVRAALVSIITACLILSHVMHAFITCLAMGMVVFMLVLLRRIELRDCIIWIIAVGLGAGLVSFWWVPGVTHLESAAVPYMLPENSLQYTAYFDWLALGSRWHHYFSPILLAIAMGSLLFYNRKPSQDEPLSPSETINHRLDIDAFILSFIVAIFGTIILSFGYHFPPFRLIPSYQNILPGRVLSFAAILVVILIVILLRELWLRFNSGYLQLVSILLFVLIFAIIAWDINPRKANITFGSFQDTKSSSNLVPGNHNSFDGGRIAWLMVCGPDTTYFPMLRNINVTNGWNIEGTPHSRAIWMHNVAVKANCGDYVVKNVLLWNSRYAFVQNDFIPMKESLLKYGFQIRKQDGIKTMFVSHVPSSYFMKQERNAISIGKSSPGLVVSFPWLAQGTSNYLEDYSQADLSPFKLIYLCEPAIRDFKLFQNMITDLANSGKIVIVEMGRNDSGPLLDIIPYKENIPEGAQLVSTSISPIRNNFTLQSDPLGQLPAMGNLDGTWMEMISSDKRVPVIGYKNIGTNKVYFIGMCLSNHLDSSTKWIQGLSATFSSDGDNIKSILMQLMDLGKPNKNIVPSAFPVFNQLWRHDGFQFSYNAAEPTPIMVSVTYTPRWKAKIDGMPMVVNNQENLILLKLPAGKHTVDFRYRMTWVAWLGIVLSIFTLITCLIGVVFWEYFMQWYDILKCKLNKSIKAIGS